MRARLARILFLPAAWLLLATIARPGPPPPIGPPAMALLFVEPVALDERDPARRRVGSLVFLRGWRLASDDRRFGGISALHVGQGRVTAIGDSGMAFEFALPAAPGVHPLRVVPLDPVAGGERRGRDSESMAVHGGRAWIAFERLNTIVRYRSGEWRREAAARPEAIRNWRGNSGPEAMVRLADGRFLIFGEGRADSAFSPVKLFAGDPAEAATEATGLRFRKPVGFRVTDAALLPDGRVLVLARRVDWVARFSARLLVVDASGLIAGATLEGRQIAELAPPLAVDNMEALSVAREGGRTIVRIASDDNFMRLQRTLLLEFALDEGRRTGSHSGE